MGIAAVVFVACLLLHRDCVAGLWCYECGTQVAGKPDCVEFAHASTWMPFWRECLEDSICVKIIPTWTSAFNETVRGCAPRANYKGVVHREGCWTHPIDSQSISCFCSSDFCNGAHSPYHHHHTKLLLPSLLAASFVLLLR